MNFRTFGNIGSPTLLLIPGLGVSYEIFLPLIGLLEKRFHVVAVLVDGFTLGQNTEFTSIDDQARQVSKYIKENLVGPLKYLQCANVWTCYHWTGFWKWVFHSHYFDVLLDECKKVYPYGGSKAVLDGYTSVYTTKLESISGSDIHFWYGTKEAFVAKPQTRHLKTLYPDIKIEIFKGMNHGQLLIDRPEEVANRITRIQYGQDIIDTSID